MRAWPNRKPPANLFEKPNVVICVQKLFTESRSLWYNVSANKQSVVFNNTGVNCFLWPSLPNFFFAIFNIIAVNNWFLGCIYQRNVPGRHGPPSTSGHNINCRPAISVVWLPAKHFTELCLFYPYRTIRSHNKCNPTCLMMILGPGNKRVPVFTLYRSVSQFIL